MSTISISKKSARVAHREADSQGKKLLERLLGKEVFSEEITNRIKTMEDAFNETGRPVTPEFNDVPEDMREWFKSLYNAAVFTEALNEGWEADDRDADQRKRLPWFRVGPSGFAFDDPYYGYSYPNAGRAARLCLKSEELAAYAGKQFKDINENIIMK
jgi:hypothetical protein